jgi:hypothetical protein
MSWDTALSFVLRPLILLVILFVVAVIGAAIRRRIPEGRAKDFLTRPVNMWPKTEEERHSWFPLIVWILLSLTIWGPLIFWAWWMNTPHPHRH